MRRPAEQIHAFEECRATYKGAVFIVASGPSASEFPIDDFRHVPMITMNGAISMFMKANVQPLFYVCTDFNFMHEQPQLYAAGVELAKNVAIRREDHKRKLPAVQGRIYLIDKAIAPRVISRFLRPKGYVMHRFSILSRRKSSIGFSKNLTEGLVDGRTVAYAALQLAYHLGFSKIIMVGFDLNQSAPRFYENGSSKCSPCSLDKHYHRRILPSLKFMAKNIISPSFSVFNLSSSSRVPNHVIPVIDLNEAKALIASM